MQHEEDIATIEVLAYQKRAGVPIFTDGEIRRDARQTVFSQPVEGFVDHYPIAEQKWPDGTPSKIKMHTNAVRSKLRSVGRIAQKDTIFLKQNAPGPLTSGSSMRFTSTGSCSNTIPMWAGSNR